jgi:hypothetical protein
MLAFTCGNSQFIAVELASKKIFEFVAKGSDGSTLPCPIGGASFNQFNGAIYYSVYGNFYKLDMSNVFIKNEASYIKLNYGQFPGGFQQNQFQLVSKGEKNWLYTTDLNSHRVLRKEVPASP